jgi:predicted heme/steroid binding protein/uncharacterized membrane protein
MHHRSPLAILFIQILLTCFICAGSAFATEEYATKTGQDCAICHVNPAGGGELTKVGEGFALSLSETASASVDSGSEKSLSYFVRLVAGYLHILFAFFWFGAILYIHLLLKPSYASRGLPRGEVKLGLLSMLIMAVTGTVLFAFRVPSIDFLFSTRFGILLLIKIALFLTMVGSAMIVVLFIGPRLRRQGSSKPQAAPGEMSLANLAGYDGKAGRPAYIAYRGEIYDVSQSYLWKEGTHVGRHQAGCDLTEVLSQAPHGEDKVFSMTPIGKLLPDDQQGLTAPQKVFYFMAYMNLGFVLLIVLILSFWNWL